MPGIGFGTLAASGGGGAPPGVELTEAVTQQGEADVAGTKSTIEVIVGAANDGEHIVSNGVGNDIAVESEAGLITALNPATPNGYGTITFGGIGFSSVIFRHDTVGESGETFSTVSGTAVTNFNDGTEPVEGSPEIHTITPASTPTAGTYVIGGETTDFDALPVVAGWSFDRALDEGFITATTDDNANHADDDLIAPGAGDGLS